MKRTMLMLGLILGAVWLAPRVYAGHADSIMAALMSARENLVAMVGAPDAATQDKYYAEVTTASQALDEALAAALADASTTPDQAAKLEEFKATWEAFKSTRESEIVPLVRAGKAEEAKKIATGVQAERMEKMKSLLADLGSN